MKPALTCSLSLQDLAEYTARQLNHFFPDPAVVRAETLRPAIDWALERLAPIHRCTAGVYHNRDGAPYFDHLHGDQYATYLYLVSRYCAKQMGERKVASKLYLLNKALFALDVYFEVELPEIFLLCHPVGTVLGKASYQDFLVVSQNCTVGNIGNIYPMLGWGVVLCANASVVGGCKLGDESCAGAGSLLVTTDVPAGHTAVGRARDVRVLPGGEPKWKEYYEAAAVSR